MLSRKELSELYRQTGAGLGSLPAPREATKRETTRT
jgi:hypothetical protein